MNNRREVIEQCIVKGLLVAAVPMSSSNLFSLWGQTEAQAHKPTPTDVLGPFYKKGAPNASQLRMPGDPGFPLHVSGKVMNTRGEKVPGARIDVWQADHAGHYDVTGFHYRTKLVMDTATEYALETIMPGHYDDRPAQHIHYMITAPGHKTLVTQIYFATDPWFEGDPDKNYAKRSLVGSRQLVRPVTLFEAGAPHASVTFDLCLQ